MDEAIRLPRTTFRVPALVMFGAVLLLAACNKPAPTPPPTPELTAEALDSWWATTPAVTLNEYSSLRMQITLRNTSGVTLTFLGSAHAEGPAGEFQYWTAPGIAEPPITFNAFPEGDFAPDEVFGWDVTVDLTSLADTEDGFAFRPIDSNFIGTVFPGQAELVDATGTLVK